MADGEGSIHVVQSKIGAMTSEEDQWRRLATVATEVLTVAQADVALQSAFLGSIWEATDTQATEMKALQEQLTDRCAELLQLSRKHVEMTHEPSRVKLQFAAEATVIDVLKPAVQHVSVPKIVGK